MTELNELAKALAKAQGEMKNAPKDSTNPHFKASYASLASVLDAIRHHLSSNGLSIVQKFHSENEVLFLDTVLLHESGQSISSSYPILPVRNDPQGYGSAVTYARRYTISAMVGIAADDDDDGNDASKHLPKTSFIPQKPYQPLAPAKEKSIQQKTMDAFLELGYKEKDVELVVMKSMKDWNDADIETLRNRYKEVKQTPRGAT